MNPLRITAGWLGLSLCLAAGEVRGQENDLLVGAAKIDITPTLPTTLSGYASRTNLSKGVHDPLSARAIAFACSNQRLVLVSTDLIGFYGNAAEPLRQAILEACQLKPDQLMLAAIHTHSAPTPVFDRAKGHPNNFEYSQFLSRRLVQLVREALAGLAPASLGTGSGSSPVGVNRRERVAENGGLKIILGRNPAAATDREVQVVQIRPLKGGQPLALLFAYATHSTSLGPANYQISGDVHGLAEQFVEGYIGGGLIAPAFAGASGNIDPWFRILPGLKTTNGWIPEPVLMGTMLGEEVVHVSEKVRLWNRGGPVASLVKTVNLPGKVKLGDPPGTNPPGIPLTLSAARVGSLGLVGIGGELFNELGLAIKKGSPFPMTLVITHCNGAAGYLPAQEACAEGGYEVQSSPFAPGAGETAAQEAIALLKTLSSMN
jgi:hypothetical protein